jgi:hypothetical protein
VKQAILYIVTAVSLSLAFTATAQEPQPPVRTVRNPYFNGRNDMWSVLLGENVRPYLDRTLEQQLRQDNRVYPCDFAYDARDRNTCIRSLKLVEVADPVDIRCTRLPGESESYPNRPTGRLAKFALVCQLGISEVDSENNLSAYRVVIQFFLNSDGTNTGYMCLSANTGKTSYPLSWHGVPAPPDEPICHIMFKPDGSLVIGADTDPTQRPIHSLVVRGNATIETNLDVEGCLRVGGETIGTCK